MNQIGVALKENLKDINWEYLYDKTKVPVNGPPVGVNAISYGLMVKGYMKYVHNRPMETGLSPKQTRAQTNVEKPSIRSVFYIRCSLNFVF